MRLSGWMLIRWLVFSEEGRPDTETDGEDGQGRDWRKSGKADQGKSRTAGGLRKRGKGREVLPKNLPTARFLLLTSRTGLQSVSLVSFCPACGILWSQPHKANARHESTWIWPRMREGLEMACVSRQKPEACRRQLSALFHSKAIEILKSMVHCLCSAGSIWEAPAASFEAWLEGSELFWILKDDAVKELLSIGQQIWKTQQWPQDWKRPVFLPIPKKGNAEKCSNYHTIALISQVSKVMLKIR